MRFAVFCKMVFSVVLFHYELLAVLYNDTLLILAYLLAREVVALAVLGCFLYCGLGDA